MLALAGWIDRPTGEHHHRALAYLPQRGRSRQPRRKDEHLAGFYGAVEAADPLQADAELPVHLGDFADRHVGAHGETAVAQKLHHLLSLPQGIAEEDGSRTSVERPTEKRF